MPFVGIGVGVGRQRFRGGVDAQAQAHYDRVIADGGVVPSGLSGVNAFFNAVKAIYATSDITTAVSVGVDAQYLGYKLGAGAGATSGQAVQKLYSCAGSSGDVVQTTAASQPLLLAHSGASSDNYYYAPGVSGNYISTTSTYENDDWDVEFNVKGKYSLSNGRIAGTRSVSDGTNVQINGTSITLEYKIGAITYSAFALTTNVDDVEYTARVTRNSTTGAITFIKNGTTLTTSGDEISGTLSSFSYAIEINGVLGGVQGFVGNINWVKFYTSGSVVRYFNPSTYNASTSQTQWTSTTGEVWTINTGTAATGYKGVLVNRTIVQSDGVDDRLLSGTLTSKSTFSRYAVMNPLNLNNFVGIVGANVADRHYLYATATGVAIFNGATLTYTSEQAQRQALYEADYNGSSSVALLNNTSSNTGNAGTGSSTALELFTILGGYNANAILNTLIDRVNAGIDTPTQKTEMYNYIRSINNNAF
jgi:hypothetical protein